MSRADRGYLAKITCDCANPTKRDRNRTKIETGHHHTVLNRCKQNFTNFEFFRERSRAQVCVWRLGLIKRPNGLGIGRNLKRGSITLPHTRPITQSHFVTQQGCVHAYIELFGRKHTEPIQTRPELDQE